MKEEIRINSMALNIATQCQRKCHHCYGHLDQYAGRQMMDLETAKKAARFFLANITEEAGGDLMFFGGEPLLNWELMKGFIPWFNGQHNRKNIFLFTITNGIALSPEIIDFHVAHGIRPITVSLNGDYPVHNPVKHMPESEFKHLLSMIRYGVGLDPGLIVPHCILSKKNIPIAYDILSFIASLGTRWINLARDLYEDWDDADRTEAARQANRVIRETGVVIQPFTEGIFDCTTCYAPSVMVYPNGDVVDACLCMGSILRDRGLITADEVKNLTYGNLDTVDRLVADIPAKKLMIRKHMDCHLFHENINSSIELLYDGVTGERPRFRVMDVLKENAPRFKKREPAG
jgi:MoaA/NifB/PqqE/SkfB family radical SAM enzyme